MTPRHAACLPGRSSVMGVGCVPSMSSPSCCCRCFPVGCIVLVPLSLLPQRQMRHRRWAHQRRRRWCRRCQEPEGSRRSGRLTLRNSTAASDVSKQRLVSKHPTQAKEQAKQ